MEFSEDNFSTYSIEFEKLLLSIGSEVDVLCKLLCKEIDPAESPCKISEYAHILCNFENLTSEKVCYKGDGRTFTPFDGWTEVDSPSWWKAYNKVKHNRIQDQNYKFGNLNNVFMALAGLYVLNRYYCKKIATGIMKEPTPKAQIFSMDGWNSCVPLGNGFFQVLNADGEMSVVHG